MKASKLKLGAVLLFMWTSASHAGLIATFNEQGLTAADLQETVDEFRDALGPNNGNSPVNGDPNGRRQIDWDALPDGLADPNLFPGDFFNGDSAPRARGIEFEATGDTTGFLVSSTAASGQPIAFGFDRFLPRFSEERLFSPVGGTTFDINFYDPSDQTTQATVRGFGAIFSGLDFLDTAQMQFLNLAGEIIGSVNPLGTQDFDLTFAGLIFDTPEVATVRVSGGNRFLSENGVFEGGSGDGFAFDDFIFGEPIAVQNVNASSPSAAALLFSLIAFATYRRSRLAA
ncbi:hypothetical protein PN836_008780 [Ningiella sp. W23]|uniref:hypothetical protein n=1 Tax=Ningiella sp. W23 TaxID=3023715 RepID=UPI00375700AA